MALIQTVGYSIGKIGTMFSPRTGGGNQVKKAVLKKTKVRREVIARNKILEKRRTEKKNKIEKESFLEAVNTKGKSGLSKAASVTGVGGILNKTLDFIGILLLGWLTDKLPQIIKWVEDLVKRIKLVFSSLQSFVKNLGSWFNGMKDVFTSTIDNWKNLDFNDQSGKVKKAMQDMENAFKGMQNDLKNATTAITGDMGDVGAAGGGDLNAADIEADTPEEKAFIATVRELEGTGGSTGYNVVYGGAVVPGLTEMTLGELYEASKLGGTDRLPDRLGGRKIPYYKDQYNSSASGALQLMPETLRGLINSGRFSWEDKFSPEIQNKMILALARQGGIKIENMDESQMKKAGNIWASLTPRYGQTTRTASQSMSVYRKNLQEAKGAGDGRIARGANQTPAYQRAVAVGRALEGQGYRAWQHPDFNVHSGYTGSGRERVMRRSYNSYHNYGEALDYPLSHNSEAQLNKLAAYFRQNKSALGIAEILWKTSGHFDHLHVSFKGGGSIDKKLAGVPSLKGAGQRQKIVIIEEEPAPAPVASGGSGGGMIIIANDSLNRFMKNQLLSELAYT